MVKGVRLPLIVAMSALALMSCAAARTTTPPPEAMTAADEPVRPEVELVAFRFAPPEGMHVQSVSVRGSFNGWGETPMLREDDGSWQVAIPLVPGRYQYKYFLNGAWPEDMESGLRGEPVDPDAAAYMPDGYGGFNAVRIVSGEVPPSIEDMRAEANRRLHVMQSEIGEAKIAVYPVIVGNEANVRVARLTALLLERCSVPEIEVVEENFNVSAVSDIWSNAEVFGAFFRGVDLDADYAVLGEFARDADGTAIVRCIVVDREGRPVWVDGQNLRDADPMIATHTMVHRLRLALGLPDPQREDAPKGRWAAWWREDSGVPPDEALAAMEARCAEVAAGFPQSTVQVFPVLKGEQLDPRCAVELATVLSEEGLCEARPVEAELEIEFERSPSELRQLWDLARGFRDQIRARDIDTDYALFAEYFMDPEHDRVAAVHFVVCDANGEWVMVDMQNAHHGDFKEVSPKSPGDCARLVAVRMARALEKEQSGVKESVY